MIQDFQIGLYTYLRADIDARGWTLPVFDTPPQVEDGQKDTDFPRLVIGDIEARDYGPREGDMEEVFLRIHTFSAMAGYTETLGFQSWLKTLLHRQTFPITGARLVMLRREGSTRTKDPDRIIHGICDYRGILEAA